MNESPFFSILVVCLNAEKLIKATIDSILQQTCSDFEIIVKDGQSKDGTLDEIPQDNRIHIYSEPDTSIYDAMNQATHYATGRYLIYMNCGDAFASENVLEQVKACIDDEQPVMVYGDYGRNGIRHCQPTKLTPFYLYRTPLCHQTIFFNGQLLRSMAPYNTVYKVLADYDLELQLHRWKSGSCKHVDVLVCTYLGGGFSESAKGVLLKREERKVILNEHFSRFQRIKYGLILQATLPKLRSRLVGKNSPMWMKKAYQFIVNIVNRK